MAPSLSPRAKVIPAPVIVPPSLQWDGNDGNWSTFSINAGSPGQDFRVLISTAASSAFLPLPLGCQSPDSPDDCAESRGIEPYKGQPSEGYNTKISTTYELYGLYASPLEARLDYNLSAQYGFDTVALGAAAQSTGISLDHQLVAAYAEDEFWLGLLGVGTRNQTFSTGSAAVPSFFGSLTDKQIPSYTYAYGAGASYQTHGLGSLVLGGFDETRFESQDLTFKFAEDPDNLLGVAVQSIIGSGTLTNDVVSFTTDAHLTVIDSTVPHIWLPREVCDRFAESFGLEYDSSTDLYTLNDTIHNSLQNQKPTVTFRIGDSRQDSTNFVNIVLPYAAFDLQATAPIYKKPTNYFPIRRAANDSQLTLGRTFLQEAYLIVDYTNQNFSISQAKWSESPPEPHILTIYPDGSPTYSGDNGGSSPDSTGAASADSGSGGGGIGGGGIAGIVIGLLVLVAILVAGWLFWRRRRMRPKEMPVHELPAADPSPPPETIEEPMTPPSELGVGGGLLLDEKSPGRGELPEGMSPTELPASTTDDNTGFTFYGIKRGNTISSQVSGNDSQTRVASLERLSPISSIRANSDEGEGDSVIGRPEHNRSTSYPEEFRSGAISPPAVGPSE